MKSVVMYVEDTVVHTYSATLSLRKISEGLSAPPKLLRNFSSIYKGYTA
jgi:hypothetical protein